MTNREMLLSLVLDLTEEEAGKAIDAITEAFDSDECESCQINLIQTEQSGHVSKLSVPVDIVDEEKGDHEEWLSKRFSDLH